MKENFEELLRICLKENELLREVYDAARGVSRYENIDELRHKDYVLKLEDAIENMMKFYSINHSAENESKIMELEDISIDSDAITRIREYLDEMKHI